MRIPCPHCGLRPYEEFSYQGDAAPERPAFDNADHAAREAAFADYVYLRDNAAGLMRELWFHTGGCQSWLEVERNTLKRQCPTLLTLLKAFPSSMELQEPTFKDVVVLYR